jgi:hypothetical protein
MPVLLVGGAPFVWYFAGWKAAAGFAIGAALSWGSLLVAHLVVRGIDETQTKFSAQARLQLLLLAKLPIIMIVIFFTNSLGVGALIAFLAGYMLVYLALVLGALRRGGPSTSTDDVR